MINVMIDEFTPCLKDAKTGELVQTEVIRIKRKSFYEYITRKIDGMLTGKVCSTKTRFYALVVEGSVDIQGMVAVAKDNDMSAVYIAGCV